MEIHFQQQENQQEGAASARINSVGKRMTKLKGRSRSSKGKRFLGVRQRPSGRWVAEIKDTTQKIRMWLGTFETAEEAARAYDEAACLLRGSNTRTNFTTKVSLDSPIASRIRNLLNSKKLGKINKQQQHEQNDVVEHTTSVGGDPTSSGSYSHNICGRESLVSTSIGANSRISSDVLLQGSHFFEDEYKPVMTNCNEGLCSSQYSVLWDRFSLAQEGILDFPKGVAISDQTGNQLDFPDFERMKVERQISASLYAINGVQEYMETVQDPMEALWDLPPMCSLLFS